MLSLNVTIIVNEARIKPAKEIVVEIMSDTIDFKVSTGIVIEIILNMAKMVEIHENSWN